MYTPTIHSVKVNYTLLNNKIFGSFLPKSNEVEFRIQPTFDLFGFCTYFPDIKKFQITIHSEFNYLKDFKEILVHEMVHIAQCMEYDQMNHSFDTFFQWKEKLEYYGFSLKDKY